MSGSAQKPDHDRHEPMTSRDGRTICIFGGETLAPVMPTVEVEVVEPPTPLRSVPDPEELVDPKIIVRTTDPETSKHSARLTPGKRGSQRFRVAAALLSVYPLAITFGRIAELADLDPWQATKRISELKNTGFIEAQGEVRETSGAKRTTWILTEGGVANMRGRDE